MFGLFKSYRNGGVRFGRQDRGAKRERRRFSFHFGEHGSCGEPQCHKRRKAAMAANSSVKHWVSEMARLCQPDRIVWCDGSEDERARLTAEALSAGELLELDQAKLPGCYLHRTATNDVARTENLTFICTRNEDDAGPTNNWMSCDEAYAKLGAIFDGSMRGRTMYVVPFLMGIPGSPFTKVGVELTDSIYVVLNMRIMTRMGQVAMDELGGSDDFTRCLHAKHELDIERRFICHFPEDNTIWSVGSGYGGNVLLGKKCLALRLASWMGRQEGWMAEHMLILGVQRPDGKVFYIAGAFPSACGKTNLAMLVPPASMPGWKVWTVGDDIAWMRVGPDGRLWAINPEAGFFGVVPGTNNKTNQNAMRTIARNTIYTNVVLKPDNTVWWEGHDDAPPERGIDWQGQPWTPGCGEKGAQPNSRFTAPVSQCPSIAPNWEDPQGVPITAILFGARRARVAPLVYQSFNWQHGTYVAATMASETTAAAFGAQGVLRRDPMAMLPFCGYNMADYFGHWLEMGTKLTHAPLIFRVNWYRLDEDGKFIWPGFGENLRVLKWILDRCEGGGGAVETPIGYVPAPGGIDLSGLDTSEETIAELVHVDKDAWYEELESQTDWFQQFGYSLPLGIWQEHEALADRLTR
ncbi:MAG: phosphoenolpyruvate carboxykinase (GTP) [Armatimonadetes bacterium]|nr:phosphoenolpyruvate carboxykinase (GTP) [Armatimonadota bacterium]